MTERLDLVGALALGLASAAFTSNALAQDCETDADCEAGEYCDIFASGGTSGCDGADCEPEPVVTMEGYCEPEPLTCTSDADCPGSLICEFDSSEDCAVTTSGVDGGVGGEVVSDCEATPSDTGVCSYVFTACESDGDCSGGLLCTELGADEICMSEPVRCDADGCSEPIVVCDASSSTVKTCLPEPIDCSAGQPCPGATTCVDIPEDVREDGPAGWNRAALCLPEDFKLLVDGRAGTTGLPSSSEAGGVDSPTVGAAEDEQREATADPIGDLGGTGSGAPSNQDGSIGCSVASGSGSGPVSFGAFLAAALGALWLRRRSR